MATILSSDAWQVAGTGDFNGDGRDDILWRNDDGRVIDWLGRADGGFASNTPTAPRCPTSWQVASIGDFNGDGRDDILWRNDNGAVDRLARPGQWRLLGQCRQCLRCFPTNWQVQPPDISGVSRRSDGRGVDLPAIPP